MNLIDAGPLIALFDRNDKHHEACAAVVRKLANSPFVTTWPCFTETMYFLGEAGGFRFQERIWRLRREGTLVLAEMTDPETDRMESLMRQYADRPMDLADASLVAIAESRNVGRVFSIDDDFYFYRLANGSVLEVLR